MGTLKETAVELRLILHFSLSGTDSIRFTFDSPDQGAIGLPGGKVSVESDTVTAMAPIVKGYYKGVVINDTLITGKWYQSGRNYPMELTRAKQQEIYIRPQEPVKPLPYRSEEVVFRNTVDNIDLAGTLTLPDGEGPYPAVVLISGSGPQDRDETIMNHKPFYVLSDYLTRNGIAVLRYDDRGTGSSKGNMNNATTLMLSDDAEAAVRYLLSRPEADKRNTGIAGHSEGGLIASIVAARNNDLAFVISLAGTAVPGKNLLLQQNRDILAASGTAPDLIAGRLRYLEKIFDVIIREPDPKKAVKEAIDWYNSELDKQGLASDQRITKMTEFSQALVAVNNPWFRYFLGTDPADFWEKVKCPVLALNGTKDLQVRAEENLTALRTALRKGGNRDYTIRSMPALNHLFQNCRSGSPAEYATIEETFAPEAMSLIAEWITKNARKNSGKR